MNPCKWKDSGLSEEHIKHLARFAGGEYVAGEYQKWSKFAQFKWWHHKKLSEFAKSK